MDSRIAHVIEHMETTIADPLSVPKLAALAELSASRFAHLFRDEVGKPPARYLRELRMERARVLLERTVLTVREVMSQVGFRDPSHFARDFRRYHGVAPSVLRGRLSPTAPLRTASHDPVRKAARELAQDAAYGSDQVHDRLNPRCRE